MTNKKILNFIPNFSFGGVETTNINLSETLIKFGYEVDLITNDYQRVNKSKYFNNIKSLRKSKMLFCLLPLIKYINNTKPDLIICSQFYANIIVLLACFLSGYKNKIILCERVPVFENLKKISIIKKNVIKFLIKRLYKKADKIVCNSYGTKNDLNKITDVGEPKCKIRSISELTFSNVLFSDISPSIIVILSIFFSNPLDLFDRFIPTISLSSRNFIAKCFPRKPLIPVIKIFLSFIKILNLCIQNNFKNMFCYRTIWIRR